MSEILKVTNAVGCLVFWHGCIRGDGHPFVVFQMRLLIIPNAWAIPVANDHYGGDGKRAPRHGLYN